MAIAIGKIDGSSGTPVPHAVGDRWEIYATLTVTGQYTTGGDAMDPTVILSQLGVGVVDKVDIDPMVGYILTYDYVNKKVQFWYVTSATTSPLTEIPGSPTNYPAAITTAATTRIRVIGR